MYPLISPENKEIDRYKNSIIDKVFFITSSSKYLQYTAEKKYDCVVFILGSSL